MDHVKSEIIRELERVGVKNPKVEKPPENIQADMAFPCFELAKELRKNPVEIAKGLSGKIKPKYVKEVKTAGPYLNFYIDWEKYGQVVLDSITPKYGSGFVKKKKALVEHTSINPNASPHIGRARNGIIGDSIVRLLKFAGYKTETHYFVNDVGKQIALLVYGCRKKKGALKFSNLLGIYIKANREMENSPEIEKKVFSLLADFEKGDKKVMADFKKVVSICVSGQEKILSELGMKYDYFDYESNYLIDKSTEKILASLEKTGKLFVDVEKRKVLDLKDFGIPMEPPVLVLTRADGTSLYPLRDIAYTIEKIKRGKDFNVVVLGEDQKLYFQQMSAALKLLGYEPPKVVHYSFVLLSEGKMSTRKGNVVLVEDFMREAYKEAYKEVDNRYKGLPEKEKSKRAKAVSVSAVRYNIVKSSPEKNITFDLQEAVKFDGDTGPYIQYTYARAKSILRRSGMKAFKADAAKLAEEKEVKMIRLLSGFPSIVKKSVDELRPHIVANYAFDLATAFNEFYEAVPVLKAEKTLMLSRLVLVNSVSIVLKSALSVLGIDTLEEM